MAGLSGKDIRGDEIPGPDGLHGGPMSLWNQLYLMASIMAHNLTRELQMLTKPKTRGTTEKRSALWAFEELGTIRHHLLQRAGRFTHPHRKLTLTMNPNAAVKEDLLQFLEVLEKAA